MADIRINSLPTTATSFNSDDYIAIDGTSAGTRKLLANNPPFSDVTLGSGGPSVKSTLSARAPRQGLVFDGTAAATNTLPSTIGTSDFSVDCSFNVPASTGTSYGIWYLSDSTTAWRPYDFALTITSAGVMAIQLRGAGVSDTRTANVTTNLVSSLGRKRVNVVVTRASATLTIYVNGVSAAYTETTAGTPPAWSASLPNDKFVVGGFGLTNDRFSGVITNPNIYNRALTAAEVVSLYEAGVPSGSDYNTASNTSLLTGANSDFSSAGNWSVQGATTISGGKLNLSAGDAAYNGLAVLTSGKRYRLTITVDSVTAGVVQYYNGSSYTTFASTAGTYTVDFTCAATFAPGLHLRSTGGNAVLDTALYYPLGLLLAPDAAQAGGGLTWYDTSGNAANITLPASGVTWAVPTSGKIATSINVNAAGSLFASPSNSTSISDVDTTAALISKGSGTPRLYFGNENAANRPFIQAGVGGGALFMCIQPYGGNVLVGGLTDGGQKFQVTGTAYVSSDITSGSIIRSSGATNTIRVRGNSQYVDFTNLAENAYVNGTIIANTLSLFGDNGTGLSIGATGNATFAGTVTATVNKSAANYTTVTTYSSAGSSTTTVHTFANANVNRSWIVSTRQQGSAANTVVGFATTYGGTLVVYRIAQSNTTGGALDMNYSASGLALQLTIGSGYGTTTWDTTITPIQG